MKSRLKELIAQRERATGERIQQKTIAEETGLNENTVSRWMSPKPFDRVESKPIVALCDFLKCDVGDLLYIDRSS